MRAPSSRRSPLLDSATSDRMTSVSLPIITSAVTRSSTPATLSASSRMPRSAWISPTSCPCTSPRKDADSPCTARRSDEAVDTVASRLTTSRRPRVMTGRESVPVVCGTREAGMRLPAIHDTLGSTISIRSNASAPRRAAAAKSRFTRFATTVADSGTAPVASLTSCSVNDNDVNANSTRPALKSMS